ncbi:MAG: STAS domain-containing protein [Thermoanaerobaculales bacterium]|jgi:anti-anti-sigma factor|nr:STAS domain-containing protein [Thermoanaerobaculales bacterium]
MTDEQMRLSKDIVADGFGLIAAAGYINNEGGQAIADAATELIEGGCGTLLIDLDGTRIINSIGVSILLEIMEKLLEDKGRLAFCNLTPTISKTFEIMGLVQYATVYPDRDTARAALAGDAAV